MAVYDLANAANWEMIWDGSFSGQPSTNLTYFPIPEITVPIQVDSNLVAVYCSSSSNPGYWKLAGWGKQRLQLGITGGGVPSAVGEKASRIYLDKVTLIEWQNFANSYGLAFNIVYWIEQIDLVVFKYIGAIDFSQQVGLTPGGSPSQILGGGAGSSGSPVLPGLGFP